MGQYMRCTAEVKLKNHELYDSKEEVLEKIKDNTVWIETLKRDLFGACCGRPADVINCNDCEGRPMDPVHVLSQWFDEKLEEIEILIAHNVKLQYIADNWDNVEKDD